MIRELRHKDDIIPIIDSLVLNFCETSVSCNSLTSLHSCMKDILKAGYHMIQSSRSITKTDAIYAAFENYIMEETYDAAFFKIAQLLFDEDRKLTSALDELQYLDFTQIGLPTYVKDERRQVQRATVIFEKIGSFRTPSDKLDCLLHTISELTGQDEYSVGTDALVPLLLMTLIRSKVPHLTANLVYMKDYNFEKDITIGRCGYALSTLEAVLNYILSSTISELSCQNEILWRLIMLGELESFKRYYSAGSFQRRDKDGNNALLLACMHGQADILEYIITQEGIKETDINDTNMTPLMYAVKSKSHRTVDILLQHPQVLSTLNQRDKYGYTAILYASSTNDLAMLIRLVPYIDTEKQLVNDCTGDSILHIAALNHCSTDFIFYLLDICQRLDMQHLVHWKNKHGQTFYHVCSDHALIKSLLCQNRIDLDYIFKDTDKLGQCPLMTWASLGRLDLLELFVGRMDNQQLQAADHDGRTILHLLALRLGKGLTMGEKSLDFIVEQFKHLIHARDWPNGNTALHLAVETAVLANTKNTITFIKAVHRHGGQLDVMNSRGEQPVDMSRISEVTLFLDELILNTSFDGSPKRYSTLGYLWTVTRGNFKKKDSNIEFVIKSGQVGRPETMKMVKRSVCDFLLLRNELQYEMPHVFLPTLSDMIDLSRIRLDPVPFLLVNTVLQRLQSFMSWLQHHPVLCYHDLVLSFVRSSAKLEPSVIRNHSFSRRRLILEKLSDSVPVLSSMMNMREQEYFFKYIQDAVNPLRVDYLKTLNAGRRMTSIRQDLQVEQSNIVSTLEPVFEGNSDIVETIKVCANAMCNHASLLPFLKACQVRYDLMEGIVANDG
ncbi:hypothetical protein RMATCC62417_02809 [Rhizopus microsporus]|nr:hypothetical protein RMATCC62417_02809 [Rhizopus microsporus]